MTVVAPQAHVDYGLANVIGFDSVEVNAAATVQVRTPILPINSVLPMWLPATCVYGPLAGDVAANPAPAASPSYTLNSPKSHPAHGHYAGTVSSSLRPVRHGAPVGQRSRSETSLPNRTWAVVRFTFGNTQYVDYRVTFPTRPRRRTDRTVTIADLDPTAAPGARQRHRDRPQRQLDDHQHRRQVGGLADASPTPRRPRRCR